MGSLSDQIVITEKTSQAKDIRAAVGARYGTRPAVGGNKESKLRAIRDALRTATRVWLATDCDREGQPIGQEILEHYGYRGEVRRVMFTAQDERSVRDAFASARSSKPGAAATPTAH